MAHIVILADGKSKESHLDNHRLLTPINGEPLLERTMRQFGGALHRTVITSDPKITRLADAMGYTVYPGSDQSGQYYGVDMIRKGLDVLFPTRNIILFGDVVFTEEAAAIIRANPTKDWAVYGRSGAGELTSPYGEYFAIEIVDREAYEQARKALQLVSAYHEAGEWYRASPWEWYFEMEQMPYYIRNPRNIDVGPHWVEINDATDDIDFESDIERVTRNFG